MKSSRLVCCLMGLAVLVPGLLVLIVSPNRLSGWVRKADVRLNLPCRSPGPTSLLSAETDQDGLGNPAFWIAHGGGVGEYVYTNSREAVLDSLARGFRFIELDLMVTADGFLVGAHDWPGFRRMVGASEGKEPLTRAEILALKDKWKCTPLFAEDICHLMERNPSMVLVTDKIQDFERLTGEIPHADRMVVEAFSPHDYLQALRAGFRHVALTVSVLYDLQQAEKYNVSGIVLYAPLMEKSPEALELVKRLHAKGCCVTVHGSIVSDKPEFVRTHLGRNISRIYTDTWSPKNLPPKLSD